MYLSNGIAYTNIKINLRSAENLSGGKPDTCLMARKSTSATEDWSEIIYMDLTVFT